VDIILAVNQYSKRVYIVMILLVALVCVIWLGRVQSGPLFFLVAFPGVVLHELAHYVTAVILRGRPEPISLVPKKRPDGVWVLGSVTFVPTWWNAGFVALAPLYVLPLIGWVVYWNLHAGSVDEVLIGGYLLACIAWGFRPSRTDWGVAFDYPLGTVALLLLLAFFVQSTGRSMGAW